MQIEVLLLFTVPWNTCYYVELEPVEVQSTKTSTIFLKAGKRLQKEKLNLFDLTSKLFFQNWKHVWRIISQKY